MNKGEKIFLPFVELTFWFLVEREGPKKKKIWKSFAFITCYMVISALE